MSDEHKNLIAELADFAETRALRQFLRRNRELHDPAVVERLYDEVTKVARVDLQRAGRLAEAARWLAECLDDDYCRAQGLRAAGHVLYARAKYSQALERYQAALTLLERLDREIDVGRTLNGALHTLIYLGRYDQALAWAGKARQIFEKQGDRLRLARLDINVGNILYRQDRFQEALDLYQRAYDELCAGGHAQDVAAVLSNIAVCCISLNDFGRALQTYREARACCVQNGMPLLVAEADYNIAYLHYLRGEYTRAIELYQAARAHCQKLGDPYHQALCDLDQSEMYLELNLSEEGAHLAQQALDLFKQLGMGYETAKAVTNLAIASSHQGKAARALELFDQARELFMREKNQVWPALIDLYQAFVLYQEGRYPKARRLCKAALRFFSRSSLASKAALCELLLARLHLQSGKLATAQQSCTAALQRLERAEAPALSYQAYFVLGQIQEALGNAEAAHEAYRNAHVKLENLRSHLSGEELKIAFLKDKLAIYESLVWMRLSGERTQADQEAAFAYIEQAKSRSLADLIAFRAQDLPFPANARSHLAGRVRTLREDLNWCYHQIELQETKTEQHSARYAENLRQRTREYETELVKTLTGLRATDQEFTTLQNAGAIELEQIRSVIPAEAMLLEYYQARGTIYVGLLSRNRLKIVPLASVSQVRDVFRLLQFQLSKFRLGAEYLRTFAEPLQAATEAHLNQLYAQLIGPIREHLQVRRLIVVPHDFLHYLPFHALFDGRRFLVDDFSISYAPSASVYYLCCVKKTKYQQKSLILGIPDPLTPHILEEVHAVASSLPNPRLLLGAEATEDGLRKYGPASRFVHIATHGLFRQDNPMFSSIRLGNSQLSLFDLYDLHLSSELFTLSGCGTGLNVVVGGDELLGLVRGLLYAGAQSVLVTLWDVHDKSTADFMKSFYRHLQANPDKGMAMQAAMREVRDSYPHPYYWAPFVQIGTAVSS